MIFVESWIFIYFGDRRDAKIGKLNYYFKCFIFMTGNEIRVIFKLTGHGGEKCWLANFEATHLLAW